MTGYNVLIVLLLSIGCCWAGKLCCDRSCSEVISYGTTITRHISKQPDYLSFPRNALIEVYAKHEDPDVWLVKYGNKKGFVPRTMILEKTVNCEELVHVDDKEATEESTSNEQVNDNSPGGHGNQELSSDPVMVATDAPVDSESDEQLTNDMAREHRKETTEFIPTVTEPPTGVAEEEMLEKSFHDDMSHSPTLPPQVDSHNSEKPVEPVGPAKQDIYSTHYKAEFDDDNEGEDVFEFDTEEEFDRWSDHMMSDRAHMTDEEINKYSDEEIINKNTEGSDDKDEEDEEDEDDNELKETEYKMENGEGRVEELDRVPEEREHEKKRWEEEDEEQYKEEEEDWKAQQTDYKQIDEKEMLGEPSGIDHKKEVNVDTLVHTTSPDHEQHQDYSPKDVEPRNEDYRSGDDDKLFEKIAEELAAAAADKPQHQDYSPNDVEPSTVNNEEYHSDDDDDDGDDGEKLFEKIAEELAAAAAAEKQAEQEELVEKELNGNIEQKDNLESSEISPVTIVTDTSDVNPSTTHDHINTVTSVVMATPTVFSGEVSGDEDRREEDSHDTVDKLPDSDEKEAFKEHTETDESQEKDDGKIPEIQEKYEQEDLSNSEISGSQQIHEEIQHYDSEILETPKIPEKEEIENDKIQGASDLEHKIDDTHKAEDIRNDGAQTDDEVNSGEGEEHRIEEERKDVSQQSGDDGIKQRVEEDLKDESMDEDLEKQKLDELQSKVEGRGDDLEKRLEGKDEVEGLEKDEQRREEDERQEENNEEEKSSDSVQPSQDQQQPSVADHPHSITTVEKEAATTTTTSTSTLVDMTTDDVPIPISPVQVASTSVSMTTDDRHDSKMEERDSYEVVEEKTVEVVHKPVISHHDDSMKNTDSKQSEDQIESEEHDGTKQSTIVSLLPSFLADMLIDVDDNLVYMLLGTMAAILLPCCVMSCRSSIKSNRQRRELENMKARYRSAEEQIAKLEEDKNQLLIKFNTELGKCRSIEEQLSGEKQNIVLLQQANKEVNELLMSTQTQLQQYQAHNDQLVGELTTEKQLHATQIAANQDAQQEILNTRAHLQQVSQRVTELEATRDQLEQEVFTTKQNNDELQAAHLKLQESHDEVAQRCGNLDEQLASVRSNLETAESLVKEKDDELKLLRECLLQLQSDESDEEVDKETESNAQGKVLSRKNSKIEKVHAMLDTTKVQTELKSVKEERRSLQEELETKNHTLQQLEVELEQTKNSLTQLQSEQDELSLQHAETEIKLKTLTEYFEHKEQNLHRKLGVEEAARQEIENREATAKEKVTMAEEERAKERVELQQLRQQMSEIEKSLMQQVITNDKRAQEALAQLRRTEQELRVANREIGDLKKRLSGSRPTSPGGSESGRPPSHPPMLRQRYSPPPERYHEPVPVRRRPPSTGPRMETRPLSAPRFPRTSSPSEMEPTHHPPVPGRQHNDTYPGPSRPPPQPHPPRDSYSLDDRDRMILRGPDEAKSLPPPPLHHHPRLPPQKSYDRMDRPVPMSDRPPLPQSLSDHHPLPSRMPPPGPRGDPNMMSSRRPPLYHQQPPPGPPRHPPPHEALSRRPGPPTTHNRQQPPFDSTEPPKPSDQHKMQV